MATLVLRPTSCSGSKWSNTSYAYDGSTSTAATVSISSSNYSSRILTCNFNTSSIPSGATINSATLTVIAKQSSSSRTITPRVDINGNSSNRVINKRLTSTSSTTLTADVKNYMSSLSNITITGYAASSRSSTFSIYEVYIDIDYTEPIVTYTVTFKDWDGSVLKTQTVQSGSSATAPDNPTRGGYSFTGWDKTFNNITSDLIVTAQYNALTQSNLNKIILGDKIIKKLYIGDTNIYKVYLGDIRLF